MSICRDPLLSYLNKDGYNVVRRPRGGIAPLDVLGQLDRNPEWLGELSQIWKSSATKPVPGPERPVADIKISEDKCVTSLLSFAVGSELLDQVLQGFGASLPSVSFALNRTSRFSFKVNSPTCSSIAPFVIGDFLSKGELNTKNPFVRRYFTGEEARTFVISDVLLSKSITITAQRGSDGKASIDAKALQDIVSAESSLKIASSTEEGITFNGSTGIAFGFKAFEIGFMNGLWNVDSTLPSPDDALLGDGVNEPILADPVLFNSGQPISL